MTTRAIAFSLFADNKEDMRKYILALKNKCKDNGLDLYEQHILGSMRESVEKTGHNDYKYDLYIPKIKGVTYNDIYKIVNDVKIC
jgi:hypothetical protein